MLDNLQFCVSGCLHVVPPGAVFSCILWASGHKNTHPPTFLLFCYSWRKCSCKEHRVGKCPFSWFILTHFVDTLLMSNMARNMPRFISYARRVCPLVLFFFFHNHHLISTIISDNMVRLSSAVCEQSRTESTQVMERKDFCQDRIKPLLRESLKE